MTSSLVLTYLLTFSLIYLGQATLYVNQVPEEIAEKYESYKTDGIPYSIANYGHIPYGKRMIGNLIIPSDSLGCDTIDPVNSTSGAAFIFLDRGNCHFVQKSKNAEKAGAKLVIIMDNTQQYTSEFKITMADDGFGNTVNIPSIFIPQDAGELLKNIYQLIQKDESLSKTVQMVIDFSTIKTPIVDLKIFINLPSQEALSFLEDYNEYRGILQSRVNFRPYYQFFYCSPCVISGDQEENCLGNGKYCSIDPDGINGIIKGRDIASEQLRQLCIFNVTGEDKWFSYMSKFKQLCHQPTEWEICGKQKIYSTLDINAKKIEDCMAKAKVSDDYYPELENQENVKVSAGLYTYPAATINNVLYRGMMEGDDIAEAVCATMENPTKGCIDVLDQEGVQYIKKKIIKTGPNVVAIVGIVIIILVLFFLFMIFVYRRMIRKEISKEMSEQVNQAVAHYIQFYESKDKQKDKQIEIQ